MHSQASIQKFYNIIYETSNVSRLSQKFIYGGGLNGGVSTQESDLFPCLIMWYKSDLYNVYGVISPAYVGYYTTKTSISLTNVCLQVYNILPPFPIPPDMGLDQSYPTLYYFSHGTIMAVPNPSTPCLPMSPFAPKLCRAWHDVADDSGAPVQRAPRLTGISVAPSWRFPATFDHVHYSVVCCAASSPRTALPGGRSEQKMLLPLEYSEWWAIYIYVYVCLSSLPKLDSSS